MEKNNPPSGEYPYLFLYLKKKLYIHISNIFKNEYILKRNILFLLNIFIYKFFVFNYYSF